MRYTKIWWLLAAMAAGAPTAAAGADLAAVPFAPMLCEAGATVTSPSVAGYTLRGTLMYADANYRGAADQLCQSLKITGVEAPEAAVLNRALAVAHLHPDEAIAMLVDFNRRYPGSAARQRVQLAIADLHFDAGDFSEALQIYSALDADGFNPSEAESLQLRQAYCLLMTGDYPRAAALLNPLTRSGDLRNSARFYLAYIDYVKGNYKEAEKTLASLDASQAPASTAPYYLAQIYYKNKEYDRALRCARQVLTRTDAPAPFTTEAMRIAGEAMYMKGNEREGLQMLRRYMERCSDPSHTTLYILGVDDYRAGRLDEAQQLLTPVAADDSAIGQSACAYLGLVYLDRGNYNAATLALDKAAHMTFDPAVQENALYNLCVARTRGGNAPFGSSVGVFEEFLKRYPSSAMASEVADFVANGYMTDNNYPAALAAINAITNPSAKVLAAKQKVLYTLGTRRLQAGEAEAALQYLTEAAAMTGCDSATRAEATLWKGEALYRLGRYAEAVEAFDQYLADHHASNAPLANYDKGYALYAQKQFGRAATSFGIYLRDAGNSAPASLRADALNRLADCRYYQSQFADADAAYARAYSANPSAGDYPRFQQGLMKGLQRNYSGEIDALNTMIDEFPTSALIPSALIEIGQAYNQLGQSGRAIETYTALVSRYPSTSQGRQGRLLLAITYFNNGNRASAIEHYKRVITDYPTSEEAAAAADDLKQIYADRGALADYVAFINNVPNAPKPENAELAELTLQSAQRALEEGRLTDAVQSATQLLQQYPDSGQAVEAMQVKADAEYRLGRSADALDTYKALAEKASTAADVNAARMGILRTARDLADNPLVVATADQLLASSTLGAESSNEVLFAKAMALRDLDRPAEALDIWNRLSADTVDLYGTKSAFYTAEYYYTAGETDKALAAVNSLIDANPPHDYWLARAFILLSDILRQEGNTFEADEYLKSLRTNYPGTEADIFDMINRRLK